MHFGAAINGVIVSDEIVQYNYSSTDRTVYWNLPVNGGSETTPLKFENSAGTLVVGAGDDLATVGDDNYLTINGSSSLFYACHPLPTYDPYNYTHGDGNYGIAVLSSDVPESCFPVKIHIDIDGSSSTSSAPGSPTTSSSITGSATILPIDNYSTITGSATILPIESSSRSLTGSFSILPIDNSSSTTASASLLPITNATSPATIGNTTTTIDTTKYTTIPCPSPTTFTYGPSTYTVSEATTLTVEDCSCSASGVPSATSEAPSISSGGSQTTSPALADGAPKLAVGGVAGLAALALFL